MFVNTIQVICFLNLTSHKVLISHAACVLQVSHVPHYMSHPSNVLHFVLHVSQFIRFTLHTRLNRFICVTFVYPIQSSSYFQQTRHEYFSTPYKSPLYKYEYRVFLTCAWSFLWTTYMIRHARIRIDGGRVPTMRLVWPFSILAGVVPSSTEFSLVSLSEMTTDTESIWIIVFWWQSRMFNNFSKSYYFQDYIHSLNVRLLGINAHNDDITQFAIKGEPYGDLYVDIFTWNWHTNRRSTFSERLGENSDTHPTSQKQQDKCAYSKKKRKWWMPGMEYQIENIHTW